MNDQQLINVRTLFELRYDVIVQLNVINGGGFAVHLIKDTQVLVKLLQLTLCQLGFKYTRVEVVCATYTFHIIPIEVLHNILPRAASEINTNRHSDKIEER